MVDIVPVEDTWSVHNVVSSSAGPFNFGFHYFEKADLEVTVDGTSIGSAFTVTPGSAVTYGGYDGGSVTLDVAVANARVVVARKTIKKRSSNLTGSQLTANAVNTQLNKIMMHLQEQERDIGRAILATYGNSGTAFTPADIATLAAVAGDVDLLADLDTEIAALYALLGGADPDSVLGLSGGTPTDRTAAQMLTFLGLSSSDTPTFAGVASPGSVNIDGSYAGDKYDIGKGEATGGGARGRLTHGTGDVLRFVPTDQAGGYDFTKELTYVPADNEWKSRASFAALNGFEANGLTYPASDGTANQILKTDGSGNLSFTDPATVTRDFLLIGADDDVTFGTVSAGGVTMLASTGDAVSGTTGALDTGVSTTTFTDSGASWTASDVGKSITIGKVGAGGIALVTTIASINSSTSIELTDAGSTTATNCPYEYGTDNTSVWDAAASAGGVYVIPSGRHLIDEIDIATETHIIMQPDTELVWRSPVAGVSAVLDFSSAATNSSVRGGIINGVRDIMREDYTDPDYLWTGVRALNTDGFVFEDCRIKNVVAIGFWVQGDNVGVRDIRVSSSGKVSQVKSCVNGIIENIWGDTIGNDTIDVYQHGHEWRDCTDTVFRNIYGTDFQPDTTGREPTPGFIVCERMKGGGVNGVYLRGYSGSSTSGNETGFVADSWEDATLEDINVVGYDKGITLNSCSGTLDGYDLDGEYKSGVDDGLQVTNSGIIESSTGALGYNGRLNRSSKRLRITNGTVTRFNVGADIRGQRIDLEGNRIVANLTRNIQLDETSQNPFFSETAQRSRDILVKDNECSEAGSTGIFVDNCDDVRLIGNDARNAGQDTSAGTNTRSGLQVTLDNTNIIVKENDFGDNQTWTVTDGASFNPGAVDGNNQISISVLDAQHIRLGSYINLVNAVLSADQIGKIVDIDYQRDDITIETASSVTFTETGNLTSLTGTASSSGTTVTGSGTSFLSEVTGAVWIKANSEYRQVRRVDSDTQLVIEEAFTTDLSADTVEVLLIDIAGIQSAQRGARVELTASDSILYAGNDEEGITTRVSFSSYSAFKGGSQLVLTTGASGTTLNTVSATTNLITGIPAYWHAIAVTAKITTEVTGIDGTIALTLRDSSGQIYDFGDFADYLVDTSITEAAYGVNRGSGNMTVSAEIFGGLDNIPSAGAIAANIRIEKPDVPAL